MNKVLWSSVLGIPAASALLLASAAVAAQSPSLQGEEGGSVAQVQEPLQVAQSLPSSTATPSSAAAPTAAADPTAASLQQIVQYSKSNSTSTDRPSTAPSVPSVSQLSTNGNGTAAGNSMSQVTSVTQLTDVKPTDWAYQALQSLVERYGCIVGYPDSTFKGQRALTRYEFAAGVNACLDRISELLASSTADLATKEDLATLQRLQEEFAAELATLRGRVDSLEARTAELEANQFSTTTKLSGETVFAAAVPFTEDNNFSDQAIAGYRIRLNFLTSFTGSDQLKVRLQARDFNNFYGFGGSGGVAGGAAQWNFSPEAPGSGADQNISIDDLWYKFPVGNRITVTLGANAFNDTDLVISPISPFEPTGTGSLLRFGHPPQYTFYPGNTGAGINIKLSDNLYLDGAYTSGGSGTAAEDSTPGQGLFNGNYGALGQLTYLSKHLDAALTYVNSYVENGFFTGLGVDSGPEVANTYGAQVNFKFGSFQIGGGGAYIPIRHIGVGDYDTWTYQLTFAINDLGGEGNRLGLLVGVAPYASSIPGAISNRANQGNDILGELSYRFNVNDNISIQPAVIVVTAPDNDTNNDLTVVGAVRTTFRF